MNKQIFCNGISLKNPDNHKIIDDLTFQRGYGAFERLRTYGGVLFGLEEHLKRLENTCRTLQIDVEITSLRNFLLSLMYEEEMGVRIYVTLGGENRTGDTYVIVEPLPKIPERFFLEGIHAITTHHKRFLPDVKTTNYCAALYAQRTTKYQDVQEVILLDEEDRVLEGGTSNIFGVINGRLFTAPRGVLPGITRGVILAHFYEEVRLESFGIFDVEECFLTSSIREVMPITMIDGKPIGEGIVGKKTKEVMEAFQAVVQQKNYIPEKIF